MRAESNRKIIVDERFSKLENKVCKIEGMFEQLINMFSEGNLKKNNTNIEKQILDRPPLSSKVNEINHPQRQVESKESRDANFLNLEKVPSGKNFGRTDNQDLGLSYAGKPEENLVQNLEIEQNNELGAKKKQINKNEFSRKVLERNSDDDSIISLE